MRRHDDIKVNWLKVGEWCGFILAVIVFIVWGAS